MTLETDIQIIEQLIPVILKYGTPLLDEIKAMVEANRDPSKITTDMINQAFDKATQANQQLNEALQG
ncbi:MAG: hypothetical protein J6S85_17350 [Methanobrevibacter sp.]|nr:hypothetical protein [Methanobrevibacter sp.]